MGKQKRAREARQAKKDEKNQAKEEATLKRRRFLKITGGAGLVGLMGSGSWYLYDRFHINWDFIDRELFLSDDITPDYARKNFVPVGPAYELHKNSHDFNEVAEIFRKKMLEKKHEGYSDIEITEQWYVVPEIPEIAHNLVKYCRKSENFLHSKLNGLDKIKFDWTAVRKGENNKKDLNREGFIGNALYLVRDMKAYKNELIITGNHVKPIEGGRGRGNYNEAIKERNWYFMFIGAGTSAIQSPMSEMIHATISRKTQENLHKLGHKTARYVEEALAEGISHDLSLEISRELNIPNGEKLMMELYDFHLTRPQYKYLAQSIRWIEKYGIQNAFNLYMDSPLKFFEAIKRA